MDRLRRDFAKRTGLTYRQAADALVVETAYWVPVLEPHEDRLLSHTYGQGARGLYHRLAAKVDAGSMLAMAGILASALVRKAPGARRLDWPTFRWLGTYFMADAIAYQMTPWDRAIYDGVHGVLARALARLARRAGPDAPLCMISHSLGTVVASDYVWDLQHPAADQPPAGPTPLQRGETLAFMYTLGSPIALWALRYPDFGQPISVPAPTLAQHHPSVTGEWVNFYNPDDIVAYPLRQLSQAYAEQVAEDRAMHVGPPLISRTPISHPWYWNDDKVLKPIAATLAGRVAAAGAGAWRRRGAGRPAAGRPRGAPRRRPPGWGPLAT